MFNKKLFFLFALVFSIASVYGVTVSCPGYIGLGDYLFSNPNSQLVTVSLGNIPGSVIVTPSNSFELEGGASQTVTFTTLGSSNIYFTAFVTYNDGSTSASLQCNLFAYSSTATTTSTTTTTIPQTGCSGKSYSVCNSMENCEWVGDPRFGSCQEIAQSSTTTTSSSTTTTTQVTTTTVENTGNGGNSGGDSGSSGGSSGGGGSFGGSGTTKKSGFYNFPSFVQVEAGKPILIEGHFYSRHLTDQTNVDIELTGVDNNWFEINPSTIDKIGYDETVEIKISFNIPEDTESGDYPFEISTQLDSIKYEETITLVVTASQITSTTFEETTTTTETISSLEGPEEPSPMTGFFGRVWEVSKKFWYIPLILVILILGWSFLGTFFFQENGEYDIEDTQKPKEVKYLEMPKKKEKDQPEKPEEKPKPKKTDKALEEARKKVLNDIRKKAIEEDRKR
jgi:hypothetical protein